VDSCIVYSEFRDPDSEIRLSKKSKEDVPFRAIPETLLPPAAMRWSERRGFSEKRRGKNHSNLGLDGVPTAGWAQGPHGDGG